MLIIKPGAIENLLFFVVLATLSCSGSAQEPTTSNSDMPVSDKTIGSIVFTKGDVTLIQRHLAVSPPAKGTLVRSGDVIVTGDDGFVGLISNSEDMPFEKTSFNVQPNMRITLWSEDMLNTTAEGDSSLHTDDNCETYIEPSPLSCSFKIKTPYLSAAVRGPSYLVNIDSTLENLESSIAVQKLPDWKDWD